MTGRTHQRSGGTRPFTHSVTRTVRDMPFTTTAAAGACTKLRCSSHGTRELLASGTVYASPRREKNSFRERERERNPATCDLIYSASATKSAIAAVNSAREDSQA